MTVKGLDRLTAQLYAIADADYLPALEAGVRKEVLPVMKELTPVDTGLLRDSEDVVVENNAVLLVAGTEYAVHVEFGTVNMEAQPYMRPAIDSKMDAAMKATADEVNKTMKKVANG